MGKIRIFLSNLKYLSSHRLGVEFEDLNFRLKDEILEDMIYEYEDSRKQAKKIKILNEEETFDLLMKEPKSFARFGDGEINLMKGISQPFQKYDNRLVQKLFSILENEQRNMYIGLNPFYFQNVHHLRDYGRFFRLYGTEFRRFFVEHCNENNIYIDAAFSTSYFMYEDSYPFDHECHYQRILNLFEGQKLLVVSGEGVLEKLKFDVFEKARKKRVIHGPSKNAFDVYDELRSRIIDTVQPDEIICFILGMAGKAMVKDLTDKGFIAWDIGHMAKDYDYYRRGVLRSRDSSDEFYAPD